MELAACIHAFEWIWDQGSNLKVQRVQLFTDSLYVHENHKRPVTWRQQQWCNRHGMPILNSDLWKRYLTVSSKVSVRVDLFWVKGKKTSILKSVDREAKAAGRSPTRVDRGFRAGKIAKSKVLGRSSSSLYRAAGQLETVHIYRSQLIRKIHHLVFFDVFDSDTGNFAYKSRAYVPGTLIGELHRRHCYRVQFNTDAAYPMILEIVDEVSCSDPC